MTDYDKLAQRIVAQGVGAHNHYGYAHTRIPIGADFVDAETFVRDWRVAGSLMERVTDGEWIHDGNGWHASTMKPMTNTVLTGVDESLPRAICEACVAALENSND